jgi:hypothetical protein
MITITNTDELTVVMLYVCFSMIIIALTVLLVACALFIDCRARMQRLERPRRDPTHNENGELIRERL